MEQQAMISQMLGAIASSNRAGGSYHRHYGEAHRLKFTDVGRRSRRVPCPSERPPQQPSGGEVIRFFLASWVARSWNGGLPLCSTNQQRHRSEK